MTLINTYDVIIIGAGMGGLSTAAFLAKEGKRVLVIEKHDKPGGFITSFYRKGCRFDIGLEGLMELSEDGDVTGFLKYFGVSVETIKRTEKLRVLTGNKDYIFNSSTLKDDYIKQFPNEEEAINKFFNLNEKITSEMYSGGTPKPPFEMGLIEKLKFGIESMIKRPTLMKYGMKNAYPILKNTFKDRDLINVVISKGVCNMVYLGYVYRWDVVKRDIVYYPVDGMQAIPDAVVKNINDNNGQLLLNTEVSKIIIEDGVAKGVECTNGCRYYADIVVSNSSVDYTVNKLAKDANELEPLRRSISKREIYPGAMINFMGISSEYDFGGVNYISIMDKDTIDMDFDDYTPYNCPIWLVISEKPKEQLDHSVTILAYLPYKYHNNWNTGKDGTRGVEYRKLKSEVETIITNRICEKMGEDFRKSILFCVASTPVSSERYTYSTEGAFMGWMMSEGSYGKFIPQTTNVDNLYLVGQWVFPGGGVAGVMASAYYLSKRILALDNIDLEKKYKEFFMSN